MRQPGRNARTRSGPRSVRDQQEKDGDVYKLHGDVEIHYRNYVLAGR